MRSDTGPTREPVVAVIGMATLDHLYVVDAHPAPDTVQPAADYQAVAGGSAGRGAIAASRLGGETRLLAACGTGVHAQVLRQLLEAEGIACTWVTYDQTSQHSTVIVARDHATRTIIWLPQPMADARMLARLPEFLDGVDVALVDSTDAVLAASGAGCLRGARHHHRRRHRLRTAVDGEPAGPRRSRHRPREVRAEGRRDSRPNRRRSSSGAARAAPCSA